jgi:hypothetical protein
VHGDRGSIVKFGMDSQEAALRVGQLPGNADDGAAWGAEPQDGSTRARVTTADAETPGETTVTHVAAPAGDYRLFYATLRDAILSKNPAAAPSTVEESIVTMEVI